MAKRNAPAQAGHNSNRPLTEEERDALGTHFALQVIAKQRVAAQKKADYDAAKSEVNGVFKLISKELGETRKDFERDVLDVMGMSEAEYISAEMKRARRHQMAGAKPVGAQLDIEDAIKDTVDDAIAAEAEGYRAGRRADDPVVPSHISSIFTQDWMRGWMRGQEVNAKAEALAAEVLARPKPGEMAEGEDPDETDEDDDDLDPDSIRAQAAALARSTWMDPTADEANFAPEAV